VNSRRTFSLEVKDLANFHFTAIMIPPPVLTELCNISGDYRDSPVGVPFFFLKDMERQMAIPPKSTIQVRMSITTAEIGTSILLC